MDLMPAAAVGLTAAFMMVFKWRWDRERSAVQHRGVNQTAAVTLSRALGYTVYRVVLYTLAAYLLVTAYYAVHWQRACTVIPEQRAVYEQATAQDHLVKALEWPIHYRGDACSE
jgi:hypothetical protein